MERHKKISAEDLHYLKASDMHPANTYFHFSFANYHDPDNMNFGVLRVLNDDNVKPNSGFTTHSHQNMEIFSYVVDGKLTHRDSAGNHEVLSRGHVQCISAGTGVAHSELNEQNDWCVKGVAKLYHWGGAKPSRWRRQDQSDAGGSGREDVKSKDPQFVLLSRASE